MIMKKIKLIAIDIGGTLLQNSNEISFKDIETLRKVQSEGIKVSLITARMYSSTKYISNVINADYGIFGNGSVVMNLKNLDTLNFSCLQKNDVEKLIAFAKKNNLYIHISRLLWEFSDMDDFFVKKHNLLNLRYPDELKSNVLMVDDLNGYCKNIDDIVKVIFVSENKMDAVEKQIKEEFPNLYITEHNKNLYEDAIGKTINYIEVGVNKKNKADGLKVLTKSLNLKSDEVLVIGDGDNDVEMFRMFENSGCMNNGSELAKSNAKYISFANNNESGVSEIINYYLKED